MLKIVLNKNQWKNIGKTVGDAIKLKFGDKLGTEIIAALKECLDDYTDRTEITNCVINKLSIINEPYSEPLKQEIWDFLYHFVIVG